LLRHAEPVEADIPFDKLRGELKGGKTDEFTNFATFLLAGIIIGALIERTKLKVRLY